MKDLTDILQKINITNELNSEVIQEILITAQKMCIAPKQNEELCDQVLRLLMSYLQTGFKKLNHQLLCSTCFYTVLILTEKREFFLNEILNVIRIEFVSREKVLKNDSHTLQAISLMYGLFQSAFIVQRNMKDFSIVATILENTFNLLMFMGYEYSKYTFIAFKTINSFKKVCGTDLQEFIFNKDNQVKLLNLVNHNWENPIAGVRDLNKNIFQTLLSILNDSIYGSVTEQINSFYWNKAKYLMLSEILEQYRKDVTCFTHINDWIAGLVYSLHKSGLVSAGADMYYTVLNKLKSETEWCNLFLDAIMKVLCGSDTKAIENFTNYWSLTTFKKYPSLLQMFLNELGKNDNSEQLLYSNLCIIKQGNKLGLVEKKWDSVDDHNPIKEMILKSLEYSDAYVRMSAFEIVCISHSKSIPGQIEFELVLSFLVNNVNSDCTVLRMNMLSNLKSFLTRLHTSFLNNLKNSQAHDMKNLYDFCKKLQEFIIVSLTLHGNYQRKITSVKIATVTFNCLSEVSKKKQKQTNNNDNTLIHFLKDSGYWMLSEEKFTRNLINLLEDPADDIRECTIQLLLTHYCTELRTLFINNLIEKALKSIKSKFFYQISCGQSLFKLIISILIKEKSDKATFKSAEDIFYFGCNELISEYKLGRNILESIENGKQLHSFMSIVNVVLENCHQNCYRLSMPNDLMHEFLDILESISNQFAWEQETPFSSDFSKIDDMVQNIIKESGYKSSNEKDQTKISGLQQIVLNCLWLNVKVSCELSSLLMRLYNEDKNIDFCEKCLNIIVHVLETSRHKGAIEAAGAALGHGIKHLSSLPEGSRISELPFILLKSKLNDLISETSKMASITRRGAGLSIMVHRIVSSDMRKGKPLFHYFMNKLLQTCNNTEDVPIQLRDNADIENEKDLPKAIYIHFLTRIVMDSSLISDVMYYSVQLAELAFYNLASSHWQIRNAALQLYGALVPKLIGQKKDSGTDDETTATVACDEFRTHSPKLWEFIKDQLQNYNCSDQLQSHSNFVPILNILANSAKRYNFAYDMINQKDLDINLLQNLVLLLGSPIYTARRLTAKCITNIFSFDEIYITLLKQDYTSENFLNGSLMLVVNCYKLYHSDHKCVHPFNNLREKFINILTGGVHSYMCKMLYEEMFDTDDANISNVQKTLFELERNIHAPGIFVWANKRIYRYLQKASWNTIPPILKLLVGCNDFENYCEILHLKIKNDKNIPEDILLEISLIFSAFNNKFGSSAVWKILYEISQQVELSEHIDMSHILKYLEKIEVSYKIRYVIPFLARLSIINHANLGNLFKLSNIIFLLSCEMTDVDMRYIAAMANNEFSNAFKQLPDEIKITAIKSAVILLQDEDEDVRNLSVFFLKNVQKAQVAKHAYICLHTLLNYNFLHNVLSDPQIGIKIICDDLSQMLLLYNKNVCKTDEYNPFASDSKNIYLEVNVLKDLIDNLKNCLN